MEVGEKEGDLPDRRLREGRFLWLEGDVGEIELVIPNEKEEIYEDGKEKWLDSDRKREKVSEDGRRGEWRGTG